MQSHKHSTAKHSVYYMDLCAYPESTGCYSQCVIPLNWCQSVFRRMGHGRVVKTLATTVCGEGCLSGSGVPGSTLISTSWSNSLIIGIYPAARARRHVLISFIQNHIYTQVPGVSSPVEICSCPESTGCCSQCVIPLSWWQSILRWMDGSWPSG